VTDLQWFVDRCMTVAASEPLELAAVDALVDSFYEMPGNGAGGPHLHIVLDDSNLDDLSVSFSLNSAKVAGDRAAVALAHLLSRLTLKQRLQCRFACECGCLDELRAEVGCLDELRAEVGL
jgi:hypothetical protein